jgi:hypothetical protein
MGPLLRFAAEISAGWEHWHGAPLSSVGEPEPLSSVGTPLPSSSVSLLSSAKLTQGLIILQHPLYVSHSSADQFKGTK